MRRRAWPAFALVLALGAWAGLARPAPLGAQPLRWEQAETEHFLFVFEPGDRPSVDELLTFCEPIYQRITGFFHSYPKKIRVVVRGRIDVANGFTSFLPPRIELYLTAPTDHFLGARTESWLKILLTHELTHYVHASMERGFFYTLSLVFGPDAAGAHVAFLPGWMIEGPSTNTETMFTAGGRGRNPLFEMLYKAPVEQGKLFSLEQAAYQSDFPPADRIYVSGYILVDFLLSTYGEDSFRRIMDDYLGFPFFGPWGAIRRVTGKSASEVFAELRKHLETKYHQSLDIPSGAPVTPSLPGDWIHPQWTDRGLYVYHAPQDHFPAIVRYDPARGKEEILHSVVNDAFSFTATRDGKTLFLSSESQSFLDPVDMQVVSDLYRLDVDANSLTQITRFAHLWQPSVSRDGARLVAVQGSGPYSRIVSVDPATGRLLTLFSREEGNVYTPAFSPDGRRLAFTVDVRGFQDVYVADFETLRQGSVQQADSAPVQDVNADAAKPVLGPDPAGEYFPSFLDNDTLLFSSDRGGSLSVYRADLATGEVARIIEDPVAAISAVRSGDSLVYSSYSSTGWCLKTVSLAGLKAVPLPEDQKAKMEYPPAFAWTGASTPSRPYLDWPGPLLWLPYPTLIRTGPGSPGVELGLGAAAYGASLLGTTTWLANAGWSFASQQPLAGLSVTSAVGPFLASLQSQLGYEYTGTEYSQTMTTSASATLPAINDTVFDWNRTLSLSLGLEHLAELDSPAPFTFAQSIGPLASGWQNSIFVTSGISWQRHRSGGAFDFDPPLAVTAALQNATRVPVLYAPVPESDFTLLAGLTIPSLVPHQVIILGVKSTDVLGGPFSQYTDSFAVPRGFPGPDVRTVAGQALASIDYAMPIALFDQPLAFSLAATGARVAVHAEGIGRWDSSFRTLTLDPHLYLGGDLTLRMAFNAIPFSALIGLAARIDTSAPSTFDPGTDLGIYLTIGSAGISGGLASGFTPQSRGPSIPVSPR